MEDVGQAAARRYSFAVRKPDSIDPALLVRFGARVRGRRMAIEPNQNVFAETHDYDRNLWGRIERGQQNVSISTLRKVAAALGTTMAELVEGLDAERDEPVGSSNSSTEADG